MVVWVVVQDKVIRLDVLSVVVTSFLYPNLSVSFMHENEHEEDDDDGNSPCSPFINCV